MQFEASSHVVTVTHEGAGIPAGYVPPLLANGDLSLRVGPCGDLMPPMEEVPCEPMLREGRRYDRAQNCSLIPFGNYRLELEVDGRRLEAPERWAQSIDLLHGRIVCACTYAGGIEVQTEVCVPLEGPAAVLIRRTVKASGNVRQTLRLQMRREGNATAEPPLGLEPSALPEDRFPCGSAGLGFRVYGYRFFRLALAVAGCAGAGGAAGEVSAGDGPWARAVRVDGAHAEWGVFFEDDCHPDGGAVPADEPAPLERLTPRVAAFAAEGVAPGFAASEAAWKRFWDSVHDFALPDPEMLRMVHVALYHLRCNATRWSQPVGIHNDLWSGKFFAFDEFFCHMGLLTSGCTELARRIPEFRRATLTVAQKRCNPFHSKEPVFGGLYPWETLEDGSNCTFPGHWEDHIFQNANCAAGAWAQFLTTRDRDFLEQTAWPILRDMARYYVSHHVYRAADGGVFIGKVTDLEKLGSAHERAYLTTCGVIYTLRCAARAAWVLGCADAETRNWAELADALPASLPEKDGHYLPFPGSEDVSVALVGGFFPYPVFQADDEKAVASLRWFADRAHGAGSMYPGMGRNILCSWYAAWLSAAFSIIGRPDEAYEWLREYTRSAGLFGEAWEINEPGVSLSRPWFATSAGVFLTAVNIWLHGHPEGRMDRTADGVSV